MDLLFYSGNIYFIDNDSARESLVRSYSPVFSSRELILASKIAAAVLVIGMHECNN